MAYSIKNSDDSGYTATIEQVSRIEYSRDDHDNQSSIRMICFPESFWHKYGCGFYHGWSETSAIEHLEQFTHVYPLHINIWPDQPPTPEPFENRVRYKVSMQRHPFYEGGVQYGRAGWVFVPNEKPSLTADAARLMVDQELFEYSAFINEEVYAVTVVDGNSATLATRAPLFTLPAAAAFAVKGLEDLSACAKIDLQSRVSVLGSRR